jgi:asparagine synthetase B (glutamine-hydrolysing)
LNKITNYLITKPIVKDEYILKPIKVKVNLSKIKSLHKASNNYSKKLLRDSLKNKIPTEIQKRPKTAYQAPEAKAFLDHNYLSKPAKEFIKNFNKLKYFNNKNLKNLIKKIQHPYSSKRLGFRENMGFIMCLSVYFLHKSIKRWKKFK